jgi:hypothetical protein
MIRDIVRAVLVLVVLAVGCEIIAVHRGQQAAPAQTWQPHQAAYPPAWQPAAYPPAWQPVQAPPEPGPIRRVARELVDLTEAALGVIR